MCHCLSHLLPLSLRLPILHRLFFSLCFCHLNSFFLTLAFTFYLNLALSISLSFTLSLSPPLIHSLSYTFLFPLSLSLSLPPIVSFLRSFELSVSNSNFNHCPCIPSSVSFLMSPLCSFNFSIFHICKWLVLLRYVFVHSYYSYL